MYRKFNIKNYHPQKLRKGGKVVSEIWKEITGLDWSEAKKRGLTDGSYEQNIALMEKLKSGNFTLSDKGKTPRFILQDHFNQSLINKPMSFGYWPKTYGQTKVTYHRKPSAPVKPNSYDISNEIKNTFSKGLNFIKTNYNRISDKVSDGIDLLKSNDKMTIINSYLSRPDEDYINESKENIISSKPLEQRTNKWVTKVINDNNIFGKTYGGEKSNFVKNMEAEGASALKGIVNLNDINTATIFNRNEKNKSKFNKGVNTGLFQTKGEFIGNIPNNGNPNLGAVAIDTIHGKIMIDHTKNLKKQPNTVYSFIEPVNLKESDYKLINGRPTVKVKESTDINGYEVMGFPGLGVGKDVFKDDKGEYRVYLDKGHGNSHTWVNTGAGVFFNNGDNQLFVRGSANDIFNVYNELKKEGKPIKIFRPDNGSYNTSVGKVYNEKVHNNTAKKHPYKHAGTTVGVKLKNGGVIFNYDDYNIIKNNKNHI